MPKIDNVRQLWNNDQLILSQSVYDENLHAAKSKNWINPEGAWLAQSTHYSRKLDIDNDINYKIFTITRGAYGDDIVMNRQISLLTLTILAYLCPANIAAQNIIGTEQDQAVTTFDEVVVEGRANWTGHEGMSAFLSGDFAKAELIFEREFISLKRAENGRYNAANDAALSLSRSTNTSQGLNNSTAAASNGLGAVSPSGNLTSVNSTPNANTAGNSKIGRNILNDGKLTYQDFALTKYMSGLSEIKLGKYEEAKKSLESSLHHDKGNADARMRVGLLYLLENNYDRAADHLEALETQRVKCKRISCDEYDEIMEAASTLASEITRKIHGN